MTVCSTGWVETAELVWLLEENKGQSVYGFIQVKQLIQIPQSMDYFYAIINLVVRVQKYRGQKSFVGKI